MHDNVLRLHVFVGTSEVDQNVMIKISILFLANDAMLTRVTELIDGQVGRFFRIIAKILFPKCVSRPEQTRFRYDATFAMRRRPLSAHAMMSSTRHAWLDPFLQSILAKIYA